MHMHTQKPMPIFAPILRVGYNRTYTPYVTEYLVISLPNLLFVHRIYERFCPTLPILLAPSPQRYTKAISAHTKHQTHKP